MGFFALYQQHRNRLFTFVFASPWSVHERIDERHSVENLIMFRLFVTYTAMPITLRMQQSVHQPTRWSVQFCSVLFPFLENLKQMWLLAFWNKIRKHKRFKRLLTFDRTTQNMRIFSGPNPFWKQRIDRWTMTHEKWKLSTYHVSVVLILQHFQTCQHQKRGKQTTFIFHLSSSSWQSIV